MKKIAFLLLVVLFASCYTSNNVVKINYVRMSDTVQTSDGSLMFVGFLKSETNKNCLYEYYPESKYIHRIFYSYSDSVPLNKWNKIDKNYLKYIE